MSDINNPIFQDEAAARDWLQTELWPEGPVCPHCGVLNENTKVQGKSGRPGLYMCNACRCQFTVTVGTLMERSKIPLHKWLMATYLLMASKKGMSTHQMSRMLGVSLKSTWFLMHRIREAMTDGGTPFTPMGGANKVVEVDETYVGGKDKNRHADKRVGVRGGSAKEAVVALVERDGKVRSHHVASVNAKTLRPILEAQIDKATWIMTDEAKVYPAITASFHGHSTVNHGLGEYVRGAFHHTNTVESYFAILKRGIVGVYHHVSAEHLKRYVGEFDFRYNERMALGVGDMERTRRAIKGVTGKRLTYRRSNGQAAAL